MKNENLEFLLCMVLLPMFPAFLFFKALRSKATVKGVVKKFRLDLGGAFAGYFALVVLLMETQDLWRLPPVYQIWEVDGCLLDEQGNQLECSPTNLKIDPPIMVTQAGGNFKITVAAAPTPGGSIGFPDLEISLGKRSRTIHLDDRLLTEPDLKAVKDKSSRMIHLGNVPVKPSTSEPYAFTPSS